MTLKLTLDFDRLFEVDHNPKNGFLKNDFFSLAKKHGSSYTYGFARTGISLSNLENLTENRNFEKTKKSYDLK
jgi:hypothetical protein